MRARARSGSLIVIMASSISEAMDSEFNVSVEMDSRRDLKWERSLSMEEYKEFIEAVRAASKKVSILCVGPTGVGKSTLLNGLLGSKEEELEGSDLDPFKAGNDLQRGTSGIHKRAFVKAGVTVIVWDTPGLEGKAEIDQDYMTKMKSMEEECGGFDIFLYCIKADETRNTEICSENSSLIKFTELFGSKMWENGIVILTFCNAIVGDLKEKKEISPDIDIEKKFQERIASWKSLVHTALLHKGVKEDTVKRIPVVPAGSAKSLSLPGYSSYWLSYLFENIVEMMKYEARCAYIILNKDRMMESKSDINEKETRKKEIQDQSLVLDLTSSFGDRVAKMLLEVFRKKRSGEKKN